MPLKDDYHHVVSSGFVGLCNCLRLEMNSPKPKETQFNYFSENYGGHDLSCLKFFSFALFSFYVNTKSEITEASVQKLHVCTDWTLQRLFYSMI